MLNASSAHITLAIYEGCWESKVPYFLSFLEIMVKIWKKFYMKGDTVTTFQHNFCWPLSICRTMIRVHLYRTHKTPGPINERSCGTNFPLLCWTETTSRPVCFSTLKMMKIKWDKVGGIWSMFENIPAYSFGSPTTSKTVWSWVLLGRKIMPWNKTPAFSSWLPDGGKQ